MSKKTAQQNMSLCQNGYVFMSKILCLYVEKKHGVAICLSV